MLPVTLTVAFKEVGPRSRTSMGWTDETLTCYAVINTTRKIFGTGIWWTLRHKTVWEFIQCCITAKGYKGFEPADLRIFIQWNFLRTLDTQGSKFMQTSVHSIPLNLLNICAPPTSWQMTYTFTILRQGGFRICERETRHTSWRIVRPVGDVIW